MTGVQTCALPILGKFILDGIPPAPRGIPQIEVTFDIDANGILKVTAQDKATNRMQHITITASSGLSEAEVDRMRREAEAHADDDKHRKELIEVRNHADNLIYTAEKALRDLGDKVPGDVKSKVEAAASKLRETAKTEDIEAIRKATDELGQVIQSIGSSVYQQPEQPQQPGPSSAAPGGEEVIDGEFKQV